MTALACILFGAVFALAFGWASLRWFWLEGLRLRAEAETIAAAERVKRSQAAIKGHRRVRAPIGEKMLQLQSEMRG